jgi:aminocarboxymuconate-semialdehyde decarboxylase
MDLAMRREWLAQRNVNAQLLSGWLDVFGYSLSVEEGAAWSRLQNETFLESVCGESGAHEFACLATVPLQDGQLASDELRAAIAAGHRGVIIGTWIPEGGDHPARDLDDPSLYPFWATAAELEAPVLLHPVFASAEPRAASWGLVNAVVRPNETALSVARLLYGGVPQRFPGLRIIVAHGGGSLPFILGRQQRNYGVLRDSQPEVFDPTEGFRRLYFDSVVFDPTALAFLVSLVGSRRVLLGSDIPFPIGDPEPRLVVESEQVALSDEDRAAILADNARRLFKLES